MPRATKIVATLGPACSEPATLTRLHRGGRRRRAAEFLPRQGRGSRGTRAAGPRRGAHARPRGRDHGGPPGTEDPRRQVRRRQGGARAGAALRPRRRIEDRRRHPGRPRLQGASARCRAGRDPAAQRWPDPARRRGRRRAAHRHARGAGRHAVEQQGDQPAGRRPYRARVDGQGHGRREGSGRDRRPTISRCPFRRARKTCTWRVSCCSPQAARRR